MDNDNDEWEWPFSDPLPVKGSRLLRMLKSELMRKAVKEELSQTSFWSPTLKTYGPFLYNVPVKLLGYSEKPISGN